MLPFCGLPPFPHENMKHGRKSNGKDHRKEQNRRPRWQIRHWLGQVEFEKKDLGCKAVAGEVYTFKRREEKQLLEQLMCQDVGLA